ncbi:MAG: endopeptidase La [Acidobacteria bacterium]|nr:endopeptidase La [Acidobacteriota bacterium]MBI3656577.1 endopeptidase La [Acidobacteriota bacterium]
MEETNLDELEVPEILPVLPIRGIVLFPYMLIPLLVDRERSIKAIDQALAMNRMIMVTAQKDPEIEHPTTKEIFEIGTVGVIMKLLKLPDQRLKVLIQGLVRARIEKWDETQPYLQGRLKSIVDDEDYSVNLETEALMRNVKEAVGKAANLGKNISPDVSTIADEIDHPGRLADIIAANLDLRVENAQEILVLSDPKERLLKVNGLLAREVQVLTVQQQINLQARTEMDKTQREYLLRQQLKAIQEQLGEVGELQEEVEQLRMKADEAGMPTEVRGEVEKQIRRLERMQSDTAETATVRAYLDWMITLPWSKSTADNLDLRKAKAILDQDHYGLNKVKERIIEYLAVRKLKPKTAGPILCFTGPPGVGKTSLGKSIARALGRKFVRMSLGGVHDEAEVRGHRRTYVGSMPGRIVQGIHQAGSNNPVFMLDEVDKIGTDYRGDPSSALLEVLDPEQNSTFRDNYLNTPFDLSHVLFITTANILDPVHPAFRDRLEVIYLTGYTEGEKLEIARRHIIPKQVEAHGLKSDQLVFHDDALRLIITRYTREAGLRNFERELASICRKVTRKVADGHSKTINVAPKEVHAFLGTEKIQPEELLPHNHVGISTGLAWTPTGGDILFVEALVVRGRGNLILTGQLGDVMKESAQAALSLAKAHSDLLDIREGFFENHDIHIHVPEGAIPKDGPSAGVTLATALISACANRPVRRDIAMSGEITLRGHILPVGGVKEKILAARRAKIHTVILPKLNQKDLVDVPKEIRKDMKFIFADNIQKVIRTAII